MNHRPEVSIIMGVFNGAATLWAAIESIRRQTFEDWEFIICNDCSTDNTLDVLQEFADRDSRIKIICNEQNCGLAASLNHCLEFVQGEYVARMDCDDVSLPQRIERQIAYLKDHPEYDLVGTYMQAFDDCGKKEIVQTKLRPERYDLPKGAPFCHATIVMRTEAMKKLNGYCISNHTLRTEDIDLWYRFFAAGFVGANIPEPLYLVRVDKAAYRRRKLKYMLHASYIVWYGCDMLELPLYYKIYCIKPIMSWLLPPKIKRSMRKWIIK